MPKSAHEMFCEDFNSSLEFHEYKWHKGKDASMKWIMQNVYGNTFLDIGGTTELVKALHAQGISSSIYDAFPPPPSQLDTHECDTIYTGEFTDIMDVTQGRRFHTICCRHSLEHCLNPTFVLWQINRMLLHSGRLIICLPPYHTKWVWFYTHFNCLPEDNWEMLFYRTGFSILSKQHGFWDPGQKRPLFKETRYVLTPETSELRLRGRPSAE